MQSPSSGHLVCIPEDRMGPQQQAQSECEQDAASFIPTAQVSGQSISGADRGPGHTQRQSHCSRSPALSLHRSGAGRARGAFVCAAPEPLALRAQHSCFPGELARYIRAQARAAVSPRHTSSPGDTSGPGRSGGPVAPCLLVPHKEIPFGHVRVHAAVGLSPGLGLLPPLQCCLLPSVCALADRPLSGCMACLAGHTRWILQGLRALSWGSNSRWGTGQTLWDP